jgi:hypothetical protein
MHIDTNRLYGPEVSGFLQWRLQPATLEIRW